MNANADAQLPRQAQVHPVGADDQVSQVQGETPRVFCAVKDKEKAVTPGVDIDRCRGALRHEPGDPLIKLGDIFRDHRFRQFAVTHDVREHDGLDFLAARCANPRLKFVVGVVRIGLERFGTG